jgi:hypothetical protein
MSENPIEEWFKRDQRLNDLIVSIDQQNLSDEEAARQAFYKVSELYHLPMFPGEVSKETDENNRSVFEEVGIVKYIFPDDELKGIVMLAIYNVFNTECISVDEAAAIFYNSHDDIPDEYFVYYFGKDVDAKIEFDIGNKTWIEAGCISMQKIFKL